MFKKYEREVNMFIDIFLNENELKTLDNGGFFVVINNGIRITIIKENTDTEDE